MRVNLLLAVVSTAAALPTADYSRAEAAFQTLQTWYNTQQGLWNTCGWWNGANCMTAIADLAKIDSKVSSQAANVFANTYSRAPAYNPAPQMSKSLEAGMPVSRYGAITPDSAVVDASHDANGAASGWTDKCYDDDGWWALAWMYAYDLTNTAKYLSTAAAIFDVMGTGGPTACGNGGIRWCSDSNYVNAIANELYLSVAAHLANRIPSKATYYRNIAVKQWSWFKSQPFMNSAGLINDGLTDSCQNNGQTVWTYNQGVILGGLVELYRANGDHSLIDAANKIATAAIKALTNSNHVLVESCEPNCGPDGSQFKGIFVRNLAILNKVSPNSAYSQVIQNSANSIWSNDRASGNGQLSLDWAGPFVNPANASTHSSAMEALVAQAGL